MGKLVSGLGKRKASPISPNLFHLYHRFECLREEGMQQLEVLKHCLEYGVGPKVEMQPNVVEIDLERESLTLEENYAICNRLEND